MRSPVEPASLELGLSNSWLFGLGSPDVPQCVLRIERYLGSSSLAARVFGEGEKDISRPTNRSYGCTKVNRGGCMHQRECLEKKEGELGSQ